MAKTIVALKSCGWQGISTCVAKVFKTAEAARKWRNSLDHNVSMRELEGKWKVGQEIPLGTAGTNFQGAKRRKRRK